MAGNIETFKKDSVYAGFSDLIDNFIDSHKTAVELKRSYEQQADSLQELKALTDKLNIAIPSQKPVDGEIQFKALKNISKNYEEQVVFAEDMFKLLRNKHGFADVGEALLSIAEDRGGDVKSKYMTAVADLQQVYNSVNGVVEKC